MESNAAPEVKNIGEGVGVLPPLGQERLHLVAGADPHKTLGDGEHHDIGIAGLIERIERLHVLEGADAQCAPGFRCRCPDDTRRPDQVRPHPGRKATLENVAPAHLSPRS